MYKRRRGQQTILRGHPLAKGLVGCWLFNEGAGSDAYSLCNPDDALALAFVDASGGPFWISGTAASSIAQPSPYAFRFRYLGSGTQYPGGSLTAPSAALQPANAVTIFWRGAVYGGGNLSNNPALVYMSYTNSNTAPYIAYGIARVNGAANSLYFLDDAGGTIHAQQVNSIIPAAGVTFDAAMTFANGGNAVGYVDGAQVCSASRSGALSYVSPEMFVNVDFNSGDVADTAVDVIYVWNRQLSAQEMQLLHTNPYVFLTGAPRLSRKPPGLSQTISPTGKASDFAAGSVDLKYNQDISPTGKASDFAAGAPIVNQNVINPVGKPSDFAVGTTIVSLGTITPTGKPSDFAAGIPILNVIQNITPTGKPSDFAPGLPSLIPAQIITPSGKASDFAPGAPTVQGGPQRVAPTGKPSDFAAGYPTLEGPPEGIKLFIGGFDFTDYLMLQGVSNPDTESQTSPQPLQLTSQTLGRWTALFDLIDVEMEVAPGLNDTVLIQENGVTIFSGGLAQAQVDRFTMGTPLQSYHCTALDWSAICDRRTVNATYLAGADVSFVFQDIWNNVLNNPSEGIAASGIAPTGTDTLDQNEVMAPITVTQAFDRICTDQGWVWWIDAQANLHAVPNPDLGTAPFSLSETSGNFRALAASATLVDYRNVEIVKSNLTAVPGIAVQRSGGGSPGQPGFGQPVVSETYTLPQPAAEARGFVLGGIVLNFPALEITSIIVNGTPQPVQNDAVVGAKYNLQQSWWYVPGDPFVFPPNVDNNSPTFPYPPVTSPYPSSGDVVEIDYIPIGSSQSAVKQSGNPLQPATPGAKGTWGSGVFENVDQVKNINLQSDLNAIANAYLNRSDFVPTQVIFETDVPGAQVGMKVPIDLPISFLPSTDQFLITAIEGDLQTGVLEFGSRFHWKITCTTGQDLGNSAKWFERLIARTENPLPVQQPQVLSIIIGGGGQSVSAGVPAGYTPSPLTSGGPILSITAIAGTPPTDQNLVIDLLDGGNSILGNNLIVIPAGSVDQVFVTQFAQSSVAIGDVITPSVSYQVTGTNPLPASSVNVTVVWSPPGLPADQTQPGVYASYVTGTLAITTASLPSGPHGVAYTALVVATGGTPPYSFSATGLPSGLTMDASGNIVGTPTTAGTSSVVVSVTDSSSPELGVSSGFKLVIT